MPELVSILIPAYNAGKWIRYTIESALSQTWDRKEIIIVDDGSLDKTLQIAREYESRAVKVVTQENRGASAARNRALEYAQGDYIQWLDADDLLAPNKIYLQMSAVEGDKSSRILLSGTHGMFYWRWEKARFIPNALWQDLTPVEYLTNYFSENVWMNPAAWLVSRRITERSGPWNERLSLNDDGEYFCRVVATSEHIKFVREARCYYRQSGFNQLSNTISDDACTSMLISLSLSIGHLRSLEDSERTRSAGLIALQGCLPYFYPAKTELLEKINTLALQLGGEFMTPRLEWKSDIMRKLFGWNVSNKAMTTLRKLRLAMAVKGDELLYKISKSLS